MAKYMPYMPTKEELKLEIEKEKANFYLQHPELVEEKAETENGASTGSATERKGEN